MRQEVSSGAPQPGSAKTLLLEIISITHTGHDAEVQILPKSNVELEKRLTSSVIAGSPFIMLDNITCLVGHPALSAYITATIWQGRDLGRSKLVTGEKTAIVMGNGNNLILGGDVPRRTVMIYINSKTSRPEARTGFKHPELLKWVRDKDRKSVV